MKADTLLIKKINTSLVLETIKKNFPISRAEVNRLCGLHKGTISNIVNELIKDNFVYETGPGESSGGRKPVMLMFNNKAGYSIGINIEIKQISGIITDLGGRVIQKQLTTLDDHNFNYVYKKVVAFIRSLLKNVPESVYGVVGIGIGFPGSIDSEGNILIAPTFKWKNRPLQKLLEGEFKLPIIINNEADVGSEAEKEYGYGKSSENILYLSINHGIGSSHIINREIYTGHNGVAGDVGHMSLNIDGEKCSCGNYGCWQIYASIKALMEKANTITNLNKNKLFDSGICYLIERAENEDTEVIQLFSEIGEYIGIGISNLIHIINPDLIVIGGKMAECKKWIHPSIVHTIEKRANFFYNHHFNLKYSKLGGDCTALGAASIGISQLLTVTKITNL